MLFGISGIWLEFKERVVSWVSVHISFGNSLNRLEDNCNICNSTNLLIELGSTLNELFDKSNSLILTNILLFIILFGNFSSAKFANITLLDLLLSCCLILSSICFLNNFLSILLPCQLDSKIFLTLRKLCKNRVLIVTINWSVCREKRFFSLNPYMDVSSSN